MKKFFSLQTDMTGYAYPLTKIAVSLLIIIFSIFRNRLFEIHMKPLNIAFSVVCVMATLAAILCIYIAVPEVYYVSKNRKAKNKDSKSVQTVPFELGRILSLVKENDIIEFEIKSNNSIVKLGASSDSKHGSSHFFDKRFYIEEWEYINAEEFEKELLKYAEGGKIDVIKVDGIKAEKWERQ